MPDHPPLAPEALAGIADEALAALDARRQVTPFSSRIQGFGLVDAYRVAADVRARRVARGEKPLGRLVEPRIEPEIVFGLARAPEAGMDEAALLGCVDWVAHGFEIVQSIFPAWKFSAADTVAAFGLHGALLIGQPKSVGGDAATWLAALSRFGITLSCDGAEVDRGQAGNVLGGPLSALRHLVDLLAQDGTQAPLAAGEVITTGTLTRALPIAAGQRWQTTLDGLALPGLDLRFD